jgi:KDO2-lipid IV(A) lauroyltransferase
VSGFLGSKVGIFRYYTSRRKRRAVLSNVAKVLGPDSTQAEITRTAKSVFSNFGRFLVDFFRFRDLESFVMSDWLDESSQQKVKEICKDLERTVFASGHIGNWEMGTALVASQGRKMAVVAQDHPDHRVTEYFNNRRRKLGVEVLSLRNPVRGILRALRAGSNIAVLGDRDLQGTGELFEFMGGQAKFPTGYATLAFEADAMIMPAFVVRTDSGKYHLYSCDKFTARNTGNKSADVRESVKRYLGFLEQVARENLTQWFIFEPLWNERTN